MPFVGGARPKAQLKFDKEYYTPIGAKALKASDLRKEYSRLRSIAQKRIKRMGKSEWNDSQIYLENRDGFKTLKQVHTDREMRHEFAQLARFVSSERSSVSGQNKIRKKTVVQLEDHGYEFVTKDNFREFAQFMEYARTANMGRLYDSEKVAVLFETEEKKDRTQEQMQKAYNNWREEQKPLPKVQNKNKKDSNQYRKALE